MYDVIKDVKAQREDHVATPLSRLQTSHTPLSSMKIAVHGERKIIHTRAKHVMQNAPNWLQLLGSRFAGLLLFETANARTQLSLSLLMHRMLRAGNLFWNIVTL